MKKPLVSCLTATHGRYKVLCEAVGCFLKQDYENKELIILNNHKIPLVASLPQVRIVNEPKYATLGDCRTRLLELADGEYVRTWDDDDLYYPWAISQGVENIRDKVAFKPHVSWDMRHGKDYFLGDNVYEAAMTCRTDFVRKYGYQPTGGDEHHPMLIAIEGEGGCQRAKVRPSYCYRWSSGLYRISGTMGSGTVEERTKNWMKANDDHGYSEPIVPADIQHYIDDIIEMEKQVPERWPDFVW